MEQINGRVLVANLKRLKKDAWYLRELFGWGKTRAFEFWNKYEEESHEKS